MAIELTDDFLVGLPAVDDDHRGLVGTINRIGAEIEEASYELCVELFDDFEKAAIAHFSREEEILEHVGYPEAERHRSYHVSLFQWVGDLQNLGYEKVSKDALFQRFVDMADFVVDDIIRGDLEFKHYLRR